MIKRHTFWAATAAIALAAAWTGSISAPVQAQSGESMTQAAPTSAAASVRSVPLIPREALYGNPTRSAGMVSPDGKWLSWLAPQEGVMNVWLAPADNPSSARRMTNTFARP